MHGILKRGRFVIDVYGSTVHTIICSNPETVAKEGNKVIEKFKEEPVTFPCKGLTFSPDLKGGTYYIWLCPEHLDVNTITHETDHLRNYILDYCSINENNDSKEASANLNALINQRVFSFIVRSGYKIKY